MPINVGQAAVSAAISTGRAGLGVGRAGPW
jgi:alkanesulfonate monooxygenase SsuD/methylene tetrahydromethanopterin reductase-like flavin-dependent oxidoreductase (luciferase family)